jgi:hypothetical protein
MMWWWISRPTASLVLLVVVSAAVPARATDTAAFAYGDPTLAGCTSGGYSFSTTQIFSDAGSYTVRTFVDLGDTRYMDEIASISGTVVPNTRSWSLFDNNTGGTADGTWPIPTGQAFVVTSQLLDDGLIPLWESRVLLASCDLLTVVARSNGPIRLLTQNNSFEETTGKGKKATGWKGGRRVCNADPDIVANRGECALEAKGKLKQVYSTPPIAGVGDQMRLTAFVQGEDVTPGGSMEMTIRFPSEPTQTLEVTVPDGTYAYQQIATQPVDISEAPRDVTIIIKKKGKKGTLLIDDVNLLSVANGGPLL